MPERRVLPPRTLHACRPSTLALLLALAAAMLAALALAPAPALAQDWDDNTSSLSLQSHLLLERRTVPLDADDWRWLRDKRRLVLGVPAPGQPPLDIVHGSDYEGITADVTALLRQQLNVDIEIRRFADRAQATRALEAGTIDLLASAGRAARANGSLVVSRPYAPDLPALFQRQGEAAAPPDDLSGLTVALAQDYLSGPALQATYPDARFVRYRSHAQAMAAVAFGQADLYLGDLLSASLLVSQSFFNYVRLARFLPVEPSGFGFGMRRDGTPLARIVDSALASLGQGKLDRIAKRWSGDSVLLPGQRVELDEAERRWISRHPVVRLAVNDDLAPVAFFDANGNFNGILADLLQLVSLRTGLRFEFTRTGSFDSLQRALTDGKADLTVLSPTSEREECLRFSRPFTSDYFVLVARKDAPVEPDALQPPSTKRLAIARGHIATQQARAAYPSVPIDTPSTILDALHMVSERQADATVLSLGAARYYITRLYGDKLAVSGLISPDSTPLSLAMRRGDTELQSILDKALLASGPHELQSIVNRWRPNAAMTGQTWRDYRQTIAWIVAGAVALLALSAAWVFHLRRQVRKRLRAERALSDQLQFQQTFTDGLPDPVYVRDCTGRLLSFNRRYEEVLGISAHDALGKTAAALPASLFKSAPDFHAGYLRAIADGQPQRRQLAVRIHGEARWIDHWVQPYRDASGTLKGVVCGWQDITDQRRLIDALQQASRAKTTFLATMSHEIRTPMSAVIGTLELALRRARAGEIDRAAIETAYASANGLLALIGDILDIVRIESGHLSLTPVRARLRDLAESVVRVFDGPARQKGLALTLEMDSSVGADVLVDPMRFKQILSNLVSNAIKFTAHGYVRIHLGGEPAGAERMRVKLSVEDSGIGIAPVDQARLFQPFSQVAPSGDVDEHGAAHGGAGLGLSICRSLCEMMDGSLLMHSAAGAGTRIEVVLTLQTLPACQPATPDTASAAAQATPMPAPARRLHVLVADDHAVNRLLLCQQLAFLGHRTTCVENGRQALQAWHEDRFDAVITDRHMPEMNGLALAKAIRDDERSRGLAPCLVLGLTADARKEEIAACVEAGMDDCLVKPLGLDRLEQVLATAAVRTPGGAAALPAPAQPAADTNADTNADTQADAAGADGLALPALPDVPDSREAVTAALEPTPQAHADDPRMARELRELAGGDAALVQRLVDAMLHANVQDRRTLARLRRQPDTEALGRIAHRIRGAAELLRAAQLVDACSGLQAACRAVPPSRQALRAAIAAVEAATQALDAQLLRVSKPD
ncbi:transporter substrate-binding domain-containing protein [Cupriavidus malaysiensis]|uniref:histidine kinase n=1 Tax=Cupriavidus malaysiensis TaxID=367825 RepID=A0ABM6F4L7_9BURK|nr:transporter substrate-binding domain-containing protein [Cupriavidus malaysiensis]AOZ06391.1 hypothetical protein BKK80_11565 [Cupriavidus malaysiensis]